jgi:hypothetical protein
MSVHADHDAVVEDVRLEAVLLEPTGLVEAARDCARVVRSIVTRKSWSVKY